MTKPKIKRLGALQATLAWTLAGFVAGAGAADTATVLARASIVADGFEVQLVESARADGAMERSFTRDGALLYRSVVKTQPAGFEVQVLAGHASQRGSFKVEAGRLEVSESAGQALWAEPLREPLCLPELFAEFVRAHWQRLGTDAAPLRCGMPIIKAKKLAPLQLRRLPDTPEGLHVVEVSPGSLGMRFFFVATRLTFSADGTRLLAHQGQFEAPPRTEGRASYLRGAARFALTREAPLWPAARFAPTAVAVAR